MRKRWLITLLLSLVLLSTSFFAFSRQAYAQTRLPKLPNAQVSSISTRPVVGRDADGRLEIFTIGIGDDNFTSIVHNYQLSNGSWSGWKDLPPEAAGVHILWQLSPTVGQDTDGRLELFATSKSGVVYDNFQTTPNGGWAGWRPMPGLDLGLASGVPAVGRNKDGRLEVFVSTGTNISTGRLQHIWQSSAGQGFVKSWATFPDQGFVGPEGLSVGQDTDGRLEVFASAQSLTSPRQLYEYYQTTPNGAWSSRQSLGNLSGGVSNYQSVSRTSDGSLFVVTQDSNGNIEGNVQACAGCGWQGFFSLGNLGSGNATVAANNDGRLEIFSTGGDRAIHHIYQTCPGHCGWSSWSSLGGNFAGVPAVGMNGSVKIGTLDVFALDSNIRMEQQWQNSPNGASGWSGWHIL
ncbi:MAG TPA: hypothetical protein VGD98_07170 [Ktedonobacteraceae bacterium]